MNIYRCLRTSFSLLVLATTADAATFVVTNGAANGPGSLRQAVLDANNSPGQDTINFDAAVSEVVPASAPDLSGPITILGSLDIIGPGGPPLTRLTVDDQASFTTDLGNDLPGMTRCEAERLFQQDGLAVRRSGILFQVGVAGQNNAGIQVLFRGFRVTRTGGFVNAFEGASVRIEDMVLDNNRADDSNCDDPLIAARGPLEIAGSLVSDNVTDLPAAPILVRTPVRLRGSVLSFVSNSSAVLLATGADGVTGSDVEILDSAILLAPAAALRFQSSTVTITNSKIARGSLNSCASMLQARETSSLTLRNSTLVSAGGPCTTSPATPALLAVSSSQLDIANTVLLRGFFGPFPDSAGGPSVEVSDDSTVTRSSRNFSDDGTVPGILGGTASGDPNVWAACYSPSWLPDGLDCEPLAGSPLLDRGDTALAADPRNGNPLTADLRGNPRVRGLGVDIGALERQQSSGSITVIKQATPKDGTNFSFTLSGPGGDQAFTLDDAAPDDGDSFTAGRTFASLQPGSYLVSELSPPGWFLTALTCTSDNLERSVVGTAPGVTISLLEGENVICTFTNQAAGSLTLRKRALGEDATFNFSSATLPSGAFSLTTTGGTAETTFSVAPGTYDVSETPPPGWTLLGSLCTGGVNAGPASSIVIQPGDQVTCEFENVQENTIVIVKQTIGGDGTFTFASGTLPASEFDITTVNGEGAQAFGSLAPGVYDVGEFKITGWTLLDPEPVCSNGDPATSITLNAGDTVFCTFVNRAQNAILIQKQALGGDATFDFTSTSLPAGDFQITTLGGTGSQGFPGLDIKQIYDVTEQPEDGWDFLSATCDNGDDPSSVQLDQGELVTCTFVNRKRSEILIVQRTFGGDGTFSFTSASLGDFNLTTSGSIASRLFTDLAPGSYSVSTAVPAGWEQAPAACSDGSTPSAIELAPGESVVCTFFNYREAQILVVKEALGGDATFNYTSSIAGSPAFDITTVNGLGSAAFAAVASGTYLLSEGPLAGWDLADAVCNDGDAPGNVTLAPGQTVTCTFRNDRRGSLTIRVLTSGGDGSFDFAAQNLPESAFTLTTVGGEASIQFADLRAFSNVAVTSLGGSGFDFSGSFCTFGNSSSSVSIVPGNEIVCVFSFFIQGSDDVADIPTLSGWGLIVAVVAFSLLGLFALRRRRHAG